MNWPTPNGEMPCGNTAALRDHERSEDESDLRRERLEAACPDADLKLNILDSILEPGDKWDFYGFLGEHCSAYALSLLAVTMVRPDLRPRLWDDHCIVLTGMARGLLDDFVEARLPDARERWIEEAARDGWGE